MARKRTYRKKRRAPSTGRLPQLRVNNALARADPKTAVYLMGIQAQTDAAQRAAQRMLLEEKFRKEEARHKAASDRRMEAFQKQQELLKIMDNAYGTMANKNLNLVDQIQSSFGVKSAAAGPYQR